MSRAGRSALVLVASAVVAAPAAAVTTEPRVVSVSTSGASGGSAAHGSALSADGRFVAFTSPSALAGVGTGGVVQLYVRDRELGRTLLASASANGQPANAAVDDPADHREYAISGDGRYAVFASAATNLVPEGDGSERDVFRKDLVTGALALVSRAIDGGPANDAVGGDPDVSFDGSRVAFETGPATNLWLGDLGPGSDVVVRDLRSGTGRLASATVAGTPIGSVGRPSISADGAAVAFEAGGSVDVKDLVSGTLTPISAAANPDLSADGSAIAFESGGGVTSASVPSGSATPIAASGSAPAISADGSRVVFETATDGGADQNGVKDVYAYRLGVLERVSQRVDGSGVASASTRASLSGNGAAVGFDLDDSGGGSLASSDANQQPDVLAATLPATDLAGPSIAVTAPVVSTVAEASVTVAGVASDASGVVGLTVGGFPAERDGTGAFAVEVPVAVGPGAVTIRATDGAGNVSERGVTLTRTPAGIVGVVPKARARRLSVIRAGRRTILRFRLDAGAMRVTVRLWRRVVRPGRAPTWTPLGPLGRVSPRPGARSAVVRRAPLRPNVYQVRVTVVSRGGVAVASVRHQAARGRR